MPLLLLLNCSAPALAQQPGGYCAGLYATWPGLEPRHSCPTHATLSVRPCGTRLVIIYVLGPSCLDVSQVICPRSDSADSRDLSTLILPRAQAPGWLARQREVREQTGLSPIACIAKQLVTPCDQTVTNATRDPLTGQLFGRGRRNAMLCWLLDTTLAVPRALS